MRTATLVASTVMLFSAPAASPSHAIQTAPMTPHVQVALLALDRKRPALLCHYSQVREYVLSSDPPSVGFPVVPMYWCKP